MKYDDASWHYGGDFPAGLPPEAGATHIGMFVAWALLRGLGSEDAYAELGEQMDALRARAIPPAGWFAGAFDEKFTDEDLSAEGNAFAASYYSGEAPNPAYLTDYDATFDWLETNYHVADIWPNFDLIAPVLDRRLAAWRQ